jgi:hypothetical protein
MQLKRHVAASHLQELQDGAVVAHKLLRRFCAPAAERPHFVGDGLATQQLHNVRQRLQIAAPSCKASKDSQLTHARRSEH